MAGGQGPRPLPAAEADTVLRIVGDCLAARSLHAFREGVAEAFARHLGYRHVSFFLGGDMAGIFGDEAPLVVGRARRMAPAYIEHFRGMDPFAAACGVRVPTAPVPLSLAQCTQGRVMEHREYMERFMFRHGIRDKMVIALPGASGAAGIGVLAEEAGAFGVLDQARLYALAPHLAHVLALHLQAGPLRPPGAGRLTGRQEEVARLAASGASTRQIAAALFITENTVKRHLTAVFAELGCQSRSQLAVLWHRRAG
ncbi:response regulator transcription factor [Yinghuangia soli]|uniref:Helix-turn-helix transcriptional regulator n=1 Tax=Yinghuangia soli TaxID=2908204 RepID=A0AA41Q2T8_9ACTN|nr:helix-turn-helix transcriptional regulator [Yinghuangia soli]MCF2530500.1 helix-turn-helix transcriptional regulator [Yinghuangia soli]